MTPPPSIPRHIPPIAPSIVRETFGCISKIPKTLLTGESELAVKPKLPPFLTPRLHELFHGKEIVFKRVESTNKGSKFKIVGCLEGFSVTVYGKE